MKASEVRGGGSAVVDSVWLDGLVTAAGRVVLEHEAVRDGGAGTALALAIYALRDAIAENDGAQLGA